MKLHHRNSNGLIRFLEITRHLSAGDAISVMNGSSCIEACLYNSTEPILVSNPCFLSGGKKKKERIRAPCRFYQFIISSRPVSRQMSRFAMKRFIILVLDEKCPPKCFLSYR